MNFHVIYDIAFGPEGSFCFNYANRVGAISYNISERLQAFLNDDTVTKISALALGSNGDWAAIFRRNNQWYLGTYILRQYKHSLTSIDGNNVPKSLQDWARTSKTKVIGRDGATIRIALGPNKSYFYYEGMLSRPCPLLSG